MVLGYLIATGIETGIELSFWAARKTFSGIYYLWYGAEDDKNISINENELTELKKEISELKDLIKSTNELETNEESNT